MCEQHYHGVVRCALGWACWKTYLGRPETDQIRCLAMGQLGNGLSVAKHHEEALSVREADLSMQQRLGASAHSILSVQGNLAMTYSALGHLEKARSMERDLYFGRLKLLGEEHYDTLRAANNYATTLNDLQRFEEAKNLLRKTIPVARRILGENDDLTFATILNYAQSLYKDASATLNDLREAESTLKDAVRLARRVLGSTHPTVVQMENSLQNARAILGARESGREVKIIR